MNCETIGTQIGNAERQRLNKLSPARRQELIVRCRALLWADTAAKALIWWPFWWNETAAKARGEENLKRVSELWRKLAKKLPAGPLKEKALRMAGMHRPSPSHKPK